jgi:hypothetical protein
MTVVVIVIVGFLALLYEASNTPTNVHKGTTSSAPSKTEDAMKGLKF